MTNIQLVRKGEDYITIAYYDEYQNKEREADITDDIAIDAIMTLGRALEKKSFLEYR